jgi:gamma-glutamylcysteine synthetase
MKRKVVDHEFPIKKTRLEANNQDAIEYEDVDQTLALLEQELKQERIQKSIYKRDELQSTPEEQTANQSIQNRSKDNVTESEKERSKWLEEQERLLFESKLKMLKKRMPTTTETFSRIKKQKDVKVIKPFQDSDNE